MIRSQGDFWVLSGPEVFLRMDSNMDVMKFQSIDPLPRFCCCVNFSLPRTLSETEKNVEKYLHKIGIQNNNKGMQNRRNAEIYKGNRRRYRKFESCRFFVTV